MSSLRSACLIAAIPLFAAAANAQAPAAPRGDTALVPNLVPTVAHSASELVDVVNRYSADLTSMSRRYDADGSPDQRKRMRDFYNAWNTRLREIDFDKLSEEGKADYFLMNKELKHELMLLDRRDKQRAETAPLMPFADQLLTLQDTRRNLTAVDSRRASSVVAQVATQVDSLRALLESPAPKDDGSAK
jgi:hypothetical protein